MMRISGPDVGWTTEKTRGAKAHPTGWFLIHAGNIIAVLTLTEDRPQIV